VTALFWWLHLGGLIVALLSFGCCKITRRWSMKIDTRRTAEVTPSLDNNKPYRTKAQKAQAKMSAVKNQHGYYNSPAPVSHHTAAGQKRKTK
jgi:hypothetical protein